ncbi:MAG: methyltransferase domain-containing protein [Acidimicrobiia bacterium]|nr:methyltransferase domain-containing protein [Acidimicrobiia bacterium]
MWSELIVNLDLPRGGEILLAGDELADIQLPIGSGQRFDAGGLVLVTKGAAPPPGATATDTGLNAESIDLIILRDAARSLTNLVRISTEAYRVLKPGGSVLITEFDAATLLDARPQLYPQLILSNMFPRVGDFLMNRHPRSMDIGRSLVRAGFKDIDSYSIDFPLGHYRDYQTYADSVAVEGWRGTDQLTAEELDTLLDELPGLMKSVAPAGEFDDLEPITVATAYKP